MSSSFSRWTFLAVAACALWILPAPHAALAQSDVVNSKHNLSVSGPGPIKATTEDRVCVFCHTPHNATPQSPLWNREIEPQNYILYTSPTAKATPLPQPTGPTKLCLTCHDGTIAMGTVVNPPGGITMSGSGTLPPGGLSDFGLDLSGHHPVSFPYSSALPNTELAPAPPAHLVFGGVDELHCTTCHDPHKDQFGKFLVKDNRYSSLCTDCHLMPDWPGSAHATSTVSVAGVLPIPPKTYPAWTQLGEWGCEACHTPHFAQTPEQLLNFTSLPPTPFSCTSSGCHSADPGPPHNPQQSGSFVPRRSGTTAVVADIAGQIQKSSAHREEILLPRAGRTPARVDVSSVGCADCHNPHVMNGGQSAAPPQVSGLLRGVSGVDRNGSDVDNANYEYEVCFKCHGDNSTGFAYIPRVVDSINTRLEFDPSNSSYHPVIAQGKSSQAPSIPSALRPSMNSSDMIYCSSCHADDNEVSNGPHGSDFAPILKERYETTDNTQESQDNYALCYGCHDRNSILSDQSFQKKLGETGIGGGHSGHLNAGIPCSACHDPHGVNAGLAGTNTGAHTHLINFDTRIVSPAPGFQTPVFQDTGTFSGGCNLVCHGKLHENLSYP